MRLPLPGAFCLALGLHALVGVWLAAAMHVPESPLASAATMPLEVELTAPEAEPAPTLETPPEQPPPAPPEETPPPAPEPEPPPLAAPVPLPTPEPSPPPAKPLARPEKPRPPTAARSSPPSSRHQSPAPAAAGPSTGAVCISKPDPVYPAALEERGIGGTVSVLLSIDAMGRVTETSLAASSGQPALDRAALSGVRRWRFKPALRQGQPIPTTTRVNVVFRSS